MIKRSVSKISKTAADKAVQNAVKVIFRESNFDPIQNENIVTPQPRQTITDDNQRVLSQKESDWQDLHRKEMNLQDGGNDQLIVERQAFYVAKYQPQFNVKIDYDGPIEHPVALHAIGRKFALIHQYLDKKTIDHLYRLNYQDAPSDVRCEIAAHLQQPLEKRMTARNALKFCANVIKRDGIVMIDPLTIQVMQD